MIYVVAYGISDSFVDALVELVTSVGERSDEGYTLSGNIVHVVNEDRHYVSQPMVLFRHESDGEEE